MDRFCVNVFMLNVAYLNNIPSKNPPVRHYKIRHATLKRSARIKIMQTFLKPVSHLSLPCTYTHLCSVDFCILCLHYTVVLHTPSFQFFTFTINQVFLVNPKMMSDLIPLSHTDQPPVILVLLPQSLRMQHMNTDTQLARPYHPINMDGFVSPCHPHAVTQICH